MSAYDVFPRRNLPTDAEPWGREMENSVIGLENAASSISTNLQSDGRATSSSLSGLAKQLNRLNELYLAIPTVSQATSTSTGFGLSSGWNTVHTVTIQPIIGRSSVKIVALASVLMYADSGASVAPQQRTRVVINGNASEAFEASIDPFSGGSGEDYQAVSAPQHQLTLTTQNSFTVLIQVSPTNETAYPANASNYATLTTFTTYSS